MRKRFHVKGIIGKGTFGSVYKALDKMTNQLCAIKEVKVLVDNTE